MSSVANPSSILLCQFEACCYYKFIETILERNSENDKLKPIYGCENGFSSFIMLSMLLDCSVYVYETLELYSAYAPESANIIKQEPEYQDLKVVRNNVHTFSKHGGYGKKSKAIIMKKLDEFKMLERDNSYPLRTDISLVYHVLGKTRYLIGSDYFHKHLIYEANRGAWTDLHFKEYAAYVSGSICGFAKASDEDAYNLGPLSCRNEEVRIELFDFKSEDLFARINVGKATAFRLLLMLSQISYGVLLIDIILENDVCNSDLWICFLSKVLALKYDETFDNLNSLLLYADQDDKVYIHDILGAGNLDINALKARRFARNLRNTIHYQRIDVDLELVEDGTTASWIKATYLSCSGVKTMEEFRQISVQLVHELRVLMNILQGAFALNKTYR